MTDNLDKADDFCNELTLVDLVVIQGTESRLKNFTEENLLLDL